MASIRFAIFSTVFSLFVAGPCSGLAAPLKKSKINRSAQNLSKLLIPAPPAKKVDEKAFANASKQMTGLLETLEKSYRTSGPTPESMIETAISLREDIGEIEAVMVRQSLLNAWREANAKGLFSENGEFKNVSTAGRGIGEKYLFELIVPGELLPKASNQIANMQLVSESEKRSPDAELTVREKAFGSQLVKLIAEKEESIAIAEKNKVVPTNSLGQTEKEHLELWQKEADAAGEAINEPPNVRVDGTLGSSASNSNGDRYQVALEVRNVSQYPTEVKVEIWVVGNTWKKRTRYLMTKVEKTLKLRAGEIRPLEVFTRPQKTYKEKADTRDELTKEEKKESKVRYRGWAVRVTHEKGLATIAGSDQAMARYADPKDEDAKVESLPVF